MSSLIDLGKDGRQSIQIDLKQLIASRAIIQARSGAGKSWFLRRLLEQTYGHVQQIVIDPEGEFYTLREKFDYVLAGKGHDVHPQTQHAGDFGRKILELGVSCIFDLYEYEDWEKTRFVKLLLKGLHDAPKNLRHPVLIVIDEAQLFVPEEGSAESSQAVINLCSQGRKRGLCAVLATQRIAMVKKSATANLGNKLVGSTFQDIDQVRAGKELGFLKTDYIKLRDLKPGNFHGYGQAIRIDGKETTGIVTFKAGGIQTKHPEPGEDVRFTPAAPTPKAVKALQELSKLPAKLAEEAKTLDDIRKENADLKRKLSVAEKSTGTPTAATTAQTAELKREASEWKGKYVALSKETRRTNAALDKAMSLVIDKEREFTEAVKSLQVMISAESSKIPEPVTVNMGPDTPLDIRIPNPVTPRLAETKRPIGETRALPEGLGAPHKKILNALAAFEQLGVEALDKSAIAALCGVSPTSGGYFNNLGKLRSLGLISYPAAGTASLTDEGRAIADPPEGLTTLDEYHERWYAIVTKPQAAILRALIHNRKTVKKDDLAETVGVSPTSGGYFNNLGRLRTLGAVDYPSPGMVRASRLLFPEGLS